MNNALGAFIFFALMTLIMLSNNTLDVFPVFALIALVMLLIGIFV